MALPKGFTVQHIGCSVVLFVGVILLIVGLATPCWSNFTNSINLDHSSITITVGLWRYCRRNECPELPTERISDAWQAARAFAVLGMVAGLGSLSLACVYFLISLKEKPGVVLVKAAILILSICSLVFMIITMSCFGVGFEKANYGGIGYSSIVYPLGGILTCVGGVVFFAVSH